MDVNVEVDIGHGIVLVAVLCILALRTRSAELGSETKQA